MKNINEISVNMNVDRQNQQTGIESIKMSKITSLQIGNYEFEWEGTTYSSRLPEHPYEVCKAIVKKKDIPQKFVMLYWFDPIICIGSYKSHMQRFIEGNMPNTNSLEKLTKWCEEQTKSVLDKCKVIGADL